MLRLHRIFCATPWELEAERVRFYDVTGRFNQELAMPAGVLFVPVSVVNIRDKRPVQYAVDENIRDSAAWLLLAQDDWGPNERNFENDYHLALQCESDPTLPMKHVALIRKKLPSGRPLAAGLPEPCAEFSSLAELDDCMFAQLAVCLAKFSDASHAAA